MKWTVYQTGPAGWDAIKRLVSNAGWSDIAFMPYNNYNSYHPLYLKAVATPEQGDLICWPTGNRCLARFEPNGWIDWHMADSGLIELTNVTHGGYAAKSWQIEQLKPLDKLIVDEQLGTIKQEDIDYIRRQVGPDSNWEKTYRRSKAEEKEMLENALSGKQQEDIKIRQHVKDHIKSMYEPSEPVPGFIRASKNNDDKQPIEGFIRSNQLSTISVLDDLLATTEDPDELGYWKSVKAYRKKKKLAGKASG